MKLQDTKLAQRIKAATGSAPVEIKLIHQADTALAMHREYAVKLDDNRIGIYSEATDYEDTFTPDANAFDRQYSHYGVK